MRIDVYTPEDPVCMLLAEGFGKALSDLGHDVYVTWSPAEGREKVDFGLEIGTRNVGSGTPHPIVHYVYDPVSDGKIPIEWVKSNVDAGHIFFFADLETSRRAHQQGIRTAKYLPIGGYVIESDKIPSVARTHEIGFFGEPSKEIIDILWQIKAYRKDWKIGLWGVKPKWERTDFASDYVDKIPHEIVPLLTQMSRCKYVIGDPRFARADFLFLTAMQTPAMAVSHMNAEVYDMLEQSSFLFGAANVAAMFGQVDTVAGFENTKKNQQIVLGTRNAPRWTNAVDMRVCGPKHNRIIDRAQMFLQILAESNLIENARGLCKSGSTVMHIQPKEDQASIYLGWPVKKNTREFMVDAKGVPVTEMPTLLRIAARILERRMVDGGTDIVPVLKEGM